MSLIPKKNGAIRSTGTGNRCRVPRAQSGPHGTEGSAQSLELVFDADGNGEVHVPLRRAGSVVDAVVRDDSIRCDAEHPAGRAVQVDVAADDGGGGELIVIEIDHRGRLSAKILFELAVDAAKQRMSGQVTVLIVGAQPLGAADKEILGYERALDVVGIRRGAAGAHVGAARSFRAPVLREPVRA